MSAPPYLQISEALSGEAACNDLINNLSRHWSDEILMTIQIGLTCSDRKDSDKKSTL